MFNMLPTGEPLTRRMINDIPRYVLSMIRPGPGIRIFPSGDGGVCISADEVRRSGGGGFGGGGGLERVAHLPAIDPDMSPNVERKVFWCSYETGLEEGFDDADGNDGMWTNAFPQQRWYPVQNYAAQSGIPVGV